MLRFICFEGPMLLRSPRSEHNLEAELADEQYETNLGTWWLAKSTRGYKLLMIYTRGISDGFGGLADDGVVQYGRTVHTYASGFHCMVFSTNVIALYPLYPWKRITDLKSSLFLGVNYPINVEVGGANGERHLTKSNSVYTSAQAIGFEFRQCPEICRFSLSDDSAVSFSTNTPWSWSETPIWFIPSFANALDWNKPVGGDL